MTKIFLACLVLFPVMLIGMLVATGTLQELMPIVKERLADVRARSGTGSSQAARQSFSAVDSVIVREIQRREETVSASLDSLSAMQARMVTERNEVARLGDDVQSLIAELRELEDEIETQRDKERKSLARIFGEMDPERAADILSLLEEGDVEFLVRSMKQRQAAEILAMLSPGVAARVSERILNKPEDARREIAR